MKYLLPAFALLWLWMIYASLFFGRIYYPAIRFEVDGDTVRVASAEPSLAHLGLKPGSVIDLNAMSLANRVRFLNGATYGTLLPLPVMTGRGTSVIAVPATQRRHAIPAWQQVFDLTTMTFSLLLAGYLGYRVPGVMIGALILFLGGGALSWPLFAVLFSRLPDPLYLAIAWPLATLCEWFPVLVLAAFAVRFPSDKAAPPTATAVRTMDGIVIAGFLIGLLPVVTPVLGSVSFSSGSSFIVATALSGVVVIVASLLGWRYAKPENRARIGVVFAAVMIGGVGYAANMIVYRFTHDYLPFYLYAELSIVIVPLAVAYAILRHRVFDITFVLNRTIVYAITSALVLVLLAAMEYMAERYVDELTRVEGIVVQFIIALFVIVVARLTHNQVDRIVDRVLFRARHDQESALRRFATTLQFYTAQPALIRDTVEALERFGRVQGAAVYLTAGSDLECVKSTYPVAPPMIDENDPASVELRAHHETLHIHNMSTSFPGELLYPMFLAGRLIGAISVGQRESGESMPPDINDAMQRIASAVAIALAAIETDRVREENAVLHARLSAAGAS